MQIIEVAITSMLIHNWSIHFANRIREQKIEVPAKPMNGDFYICFYGRDIVRTLTELQNATGTPITI